MSVEDYFDFHDLDFDEDEQDVQCRFCKRRGFHWQEHYGASGAAKWRLFTGNNRLHDCRATKPDADVFDAVPE